MDTNNSVIVAEPRVVNLAVNDHKLNMESAEQIGVGFAEHFAKFRELKRAAEAAPKSNSALARVLRLQIKQVRLDADKTHKAMKAQSLAYGRAVDGAKNMLLVELTPVEEGLEAIEHAEEIRKEAERKQRLADRQAAMELASPGCSASYGETLAAMEQSAFDQLLAGVKAAKAAADEAKRLADESEKKRKEEEAAEKARLKKEADDAKEALRQQQVQRDAEAAAAKVERDKLAAGKRKADAEAAKLRAEQELARKAKEEAEAAEKERQHKLAVGKDWEKMRVWLTMFTKALDSEPAFDTAIAQEMAAGITDAIERAAEYAKEGEE